jgi:two-component system, cell cycle response regulator
VRKSRSGNASGYTILLVDDNAEYLETTRILLGHEGHAVICAEDGEAALALLRERHVDLMLLDFYMPGLTGEEVVARLRIFNPYVQVILQTGYASEQPPRELLRRLDIQGYHDKSEGPEKLLMWTDVGLKFADSIRMLNKSRQGLRYILDTTPDLHKIQPLDDLLQGILYQVAGLLGAVNSFLAVLPEGSGQLEGFVATIEDDTELIVRAGTGRFSGRGDLSGLLEEGNAAIVAETLKRTSISVSEAVTLVPLRVGEATLGLIYLDRPATQKEDVELLQVFANQAAVAIQNMQLYNLATLDSLTGAFARGFFDKWLLRELRTSLRSQAPLALLMIDLDAMKKVNDTAGHLAGDQALKTVGSVLRQATRTTDVVGRYGGDEFAVVLPQSEAEGSEVVIRRILRLLEERPLDTPAGPYPISVSIGLSLLGANDFDQAELPRPISQDYFLLMAQELIKNADGGLYQAKKDKEGRYRFGDPTGWLPAGAMAPADERDR